LTPAAPAQGLAVLAAAPRLNVYGVLMEEREPECPG